LLAYAALYGAVRFTIEFFRADPRGDIAGMTSLTGLSTSQLISLLVGVAGLILLIVRWRRSGGTPAPDDDEAAVARARAA
jgi:prolipoprotein diacylglyceryltransferase